MDQLHDKFLSMMNVIGSDDETRADDCLATARAYLSANLGETWDTVPDLIQSDCVLAVAADLFNQKDARNGVMNVNSDAIEPFRVSADPLRAAWPKLRAAGVLAGMGIA